MTQPKTPSESHTHSHTDSCSRQAFERHESAVWVRRFSGTGQHVAQTGTFSHTYAAIVFVTRGLSRIRHTGDRVRWQAVGREALGE